LRIERHIGAHPRRKFSHSKAHSLLWEIFHSKVLLIRSLQAASLSTRSHRFGDGSALADEYVKDKVDDGGTWEVADRRSDERWQEMLKVNRQKQNAERTKKRKLKIW